MGHVGILLFLTACAHHQREESPRLLRSSRPAAGTVVGVTTRVGNSSPADHDAAYAAIEHWEAMLSEWRPDSFTSLASSGEEQVLPPSAVHLFAVAFDVQERSQGAFNLAWRGGSFALAADRLRVEPGTTLDFGGILKGFLADRAAEALRDRGVADAVVDAGGDIVAFGVSSDGEGGWPVAVEVGGIREQLVLRNGALSSSSMEQQPGHIKDARTGAAASQLAGVFVTAPEGVLADAYATGAFAFGGLFRVPEGVCVTAIRAGGRMESTCPVGTGADQGR